LAPLPTFFGYHAATVMGVTTIYVVGTMSFSGVLGPGLIPSLIPIGPLAGLLAVVTLLLIIAVASNKIQTWPLLRRFVAKKQLTR
jgi:fluoroquinolone transport system permease protein